MCCSGRLRIYTRKFPGKINWRRKIKTVRQQHTELQRQIQELNKQLSEAERKKEQYENLKAGKKATLKGNSSMTRTVADLRNKCEKAKHFVTKCNDIQAELDERQSEKAALFEEFWDLKHKLREQTFFSTKYENIKTSAKIVRKESSDLRNKIQEQRKSLQDYEGLEGRYKASKEEHELRWQETAALREKLQVLQHLDDKRSNECRSQQELERLCSEKGALAEERLYLKHKLREQTAFSTENDDIKSAAEAVSIEISDFHNQIRDLRKNPQDSNLVKARYKVAEKNGRHSVKKKTFLIDELEVLEDLNKKKVESN